MGARFRAAPAELVARGLSAYERRFAPELLPLSAAVSQLSGKVCGIA
jgi:hypothetical protein